MTEPPTIAAAMTEPPTIAAAMTEPPTIAAAMTEPPSTAVPGAAAAAPGAEAGAACDPGALPAEARFPRRYRGPVGALRLARHPLWDWLRLHRPGTVRLRPDASVAYPRRRTRLIHRRLDAGQVAALLAACRRERTTVHGALAAAMVLAVGAETLPAPRRVVIGSPLDLRAELDPPVPADAAGAFVATVPSFVAYRPGELWATARAISRDTARRRRGGGHLAMLHLVGVSGPASVAGSGRFIDLVERSGPVNFCLSNIGRFDFPDRIGGWWLSGGQFVAGLSVCGYFVATVNTCHHRLSWNFLYIEGALARQRAQRLAQCCVDTVLAHLDTPPTGRPPCPAG